MGAIKRAFGLEPPVESVGTFEEIAERELGTWANGSWDGAGVNTSGSIFSSGGTNALRLSVVYACVNLISNKISQLPVKYWRVDPKTGERMEQMELPQWVRNPDPAYGVLGLSWNDLVSQIVTSLLLNGNAFVAYSCSRPGVVREVKALDPTQCTIQSIGDNKLELRVGGRVPAFDVIPIRNLVPPGEVLGISPIKACQRSLTVAEGAQEQTATFFTQGSTIPGQIIFKNEVTQEEIKRFMNRWNMMKSGVGKSHRPLMLQDAEYKPMAVSPEDAQALETWRWSDARVAAQIFGVDPSWLAIPSHSDNQTYSNIGARHRAFFENALQPLVRRLEQAFSWFCPKNGTAVLRFDSSEFTADDARTRWHVLVSAYKAGLMTLNEVRTSEGLPPVEGGDEIKKSSPPPIPQKEPTNEGEGEEQDNLSNDD